MILVVTGSNRGIGAAIALAGAQQGYAVAVNHLAAEKQAKEVVDAIASKGGRAISVEADVTQESEVERLKSSKRALNKRLNAWKQDFTESSGRPPKAADIQQDNEMLALYEELKGIKLQLKKLDGGAVGGGDD